MTAVWYVGPSDVRRISTSDWARGGIGGAATVQWDSSNGWSIPAASFTAPQLAILAAHPDFNVNAADGPNTNRTGGGTTQTTQTSASQAYVDNAVAALKADPGLGDELACSMDDLGGTTTPLTPSVITAIAGVPPLVVFPTKRDVWLEWSSVRVGVTAAGAGAIAAAPYELTGGTLVAAGAPNRALGGNFLAGTYSSIQDLPDGKFRLGPVTSVRVFRLIAYIFRDTSSALAGAVSGGANNGQKPMLRAVAL
jgi:hypothetical protein